MKTNRIFILINELEENQFGNMPGLERPLISFQDLLSMNRTEQISITINDIFIGNTAKWVNIKERIEEYKQLSYLRDGKLEIIYFSIYDVLTRLYTNDADKYFHFYDNCVHRKEIEDLVAQFPQSFSCKFINRSNENLQEEINVSKTKTLFKTVRKAINLDFLSISNELPALRMA